ncbi:MAG: flp pilus-assembly TadE/G-like family protein [Actinobacteria bacterium]|nr:flp pilus-assembly TadE/G-like family protein [Actinomycetota bacterium]
MDRSTKSESGQISILVLAVVIAFLLGTIAIGMVAEVLIAQQRLNAKAEAIALAGARELEFNQEQACVFAQEYSTTNFGTQAECEANSASIEILLSEPNPNRFLSTFLPKIQASSRAGIASDD